MIKFICHFRSCQYFLSFSNIWYNLLQLFVSSHRSVQVISVVICFVKLCQPIDISLYSCCFSNCVRIFDIFDGATGRTFNSIFRRVFFKLSKPYLHFKWRNHRSVSLDVGIFLLTYGRKVAYFWLTNPKSPLVSFP